MVHYHREVVMTREEWLENGVAELRPVFESAGYPLPQSVRVSVGWPRSKRKAIGQYWEKRAATDEVSQIFISPVLATGVEALDTLSHELVHAAIDPVGGHGAKFARAMRAVGLEGKPTHAGAGPALRTVLEAIAARLGAYPHAQLNPNAALPKQTTRLLKVVCEQCEYTARVTAKWLTEYGPPLCPNDEHRGEPMVTESARV